MSENNTNETKAKTKTVNSRLLTNYGISPTPGSPPISFLKTYHLQLEETKWAEIGLHGEIWSFDYIF